VRPARRIDELEVDGEPVAAVLDAAFEQVTDAELPLLRVDRLALIAAFSTGIFGAFRIRCWRARGLAAGVAAHGLGTARMLALDETAGAFASLAKGLCGLATALFVPLLVRMMAR
jgi:LrgB-like family protein